MVIVTLHELTMMDIIFIILMMMMMMMRIAFVILCRWNTFAWRCTRSQRNHVRRCSKQFPKEKRQRNALHTTIHDAQYNMHILRITWICLVDLCHISDPCHAGTIFQVAPNKINMTPNMNPCKRRPYCWWTWDVSNPVNDGINCQRQLASRISCINRMI